MKLTSEIGVKPYFLLHLQTENTFPKIPTHKAVCFHAEPGLSPSFPNAAKLNELTVNNELGEEIIK